MKKFLMRLAFVAAALMPAASVLAADLEPPPPEPLRGSIYAGVFGSAIAVEADYSADSSCGSCTSQNESISGIGYGGGVLIGASYKFDPSILVGIEADWTFGGQVAENNAPAEQTYMDFDNLATLRGRVGWGNDMGLIYLTGGLAAVDVTFGGAVGPLAEDQSDDNWVYGWTVGGGIEYNFTDSVAARLEYLYVNLPEEGYTLIASDGSGGQLNVETQDMSLIRAGIVYNFSF